MKPIAMPFLRLMALSVLVTVSGCIYPIQLADEKPFKDERLAFLEIGTTTKEEVAASMSNFTIYYDYGEIVENLTPWKFRGGDWWLYTRDREMLQFEVWPLGAGSEIPVGDGTDHRFLLIKFDENGVVFDYEVSSMLDDGCNNSGVCKNFYDYMLLAPRDQDDLAKTFQLPDDGCGVYMYVEKRTKILYPIRVAFDDRPATRIIDHDGYLYWVADHSQHRIKVTNVGSIEVTTVGNPLIGSDIDCEQSRVAIVEYSNRDRGSDMRLDHVEESKGRREIIKRRLIVMD